MTSCCLVFLGEGVDEDSPVELAWDRLFYGSYQECLDKFHSWMTSIFSAYEGYQNVQKKDIRQQVKREYFLSTDGVKLWVRFKYIDDYEREYPDDPEFEQRFPVTQLSYGVCGGLKLDFYALVLTEESYVRYIVGWRAG